MIRVPRPRVVSVRRHHPGQVSPGDTAEVRLDPGLIAFLENTPAGSPVPLGAGFQARYNVPVSMAASAAVAVLSPADRAGTYWSGRDLEVEWFGSAGLGDTVLALARLEEISERLTRFTVYGRTLTDAPLYRGTLRMIAMRDGRPVGFRSQAEYETVRARVGQASRPVQVEPRALLQSVTAPDSLPLGRSATLVIEVTNPETHSISVTVTAQPPYGAGLSLDFPPVQHLQLTPGETARASFAIRADRPHQVNLGQPWELQISANDETRRVAIQVPDPHPGRTFYLLTEDCETFDGGPLTGDYASRGMERFGNHNNVMDPEDYRVQMILKPNRLNQIAERHGARWTHFYAATQRFGAEWAARQSSTGEWNRILREMDDAVRAGSERHEYCPHIHFDYEPDSALRPQPRLLYDRATDGILPNDYYHPETNPTHRYHDWDGTARDGIAYIKTLGDWTDGDSKSGSLRKSLLHLARLQANRRAPAVARTGSFDFGKSPADQAISTQAYLANGLRGNSDAYRPGVPPMAGGQMFWCAEQDRQQPVTSLRDARLVQFGITMDTFLRSAEEMNKWFAAHWESSQGPGIHALLFMTHAMFCGGEPDPFRSLEGGSFEQLDRHLAWVREHYPQVEFATATEALLEYLDYYTPVLDTYTEPLLTGGDPSSGRYEFAVRLLGRGIRVDDGHSATVQIAAPVCFSPSELLEMRVKQDGREIAAESAFDAGFQPVVIATLTSRAPLRLEVVLRPEAIARALTWFQDADGIEFHDPPEAPEPDLFRVRPPVIEGDRMRFFGDVVRLLMNPIAGHTEPLGRRVHPLGGLTLGAALTAAFRAAGENRPEAPRGVVPLRMKLRWLREVDLQSTFVAESQAAGEATAVRIHDDSGALVAQAEIVVQKIEATSLELLTEALTTEWWGRRFACPSPTSENPLPIDAWERDFAAAMSTYRGQRAWKIMLAVRRVYDILTRGTWKHRVSLLWWIPGFLLGRSSGLTEYDLKFPDPAVYFKQKNPPGADRE
jgi:hypothetical protein